MSPLIANTDDLLSILDRVLDKSIVVESWVPIGLQGGEFWVADATARVASCAVYLGYGEQGSWKDGKEAEKLFPYWQRDLWTK